MTSPSARATRPCPEGATTTPSTTSRRPRRRAGRGLARLFIMKGGCRGSCRRGSRWRAWTRGSSGSAQTVERKERRLWNLRRDCGEERVREHLVAGGPQVKAVGVHVFGLVPEE